MVDQAIVFLREQGLTGMIIYTLVSGIVLALAIPLQFIDLCLGLVYPFQEAVLILIISKVIGAALSYGIANHFLNEEQKRNYVNSKYFRGLYELVRKEPFKYGLLLRFGGLPTIVRNYGLAVLPLNFSTYIVIAFIQSIVSSVMQAYTAG